MMLQDIIYAGRRLSILEGGSVAAGHRPGVWIGKVVSADKLPEAMEERLVSR